MKKKLLSDLIKLANVLDSAGLMQDANFVSDIIAAEVNPALGFAAKVNLESKNLYDLVQKDPQEAKRKLTEIANYMRSLSHALNEIKPAAAPEEKTPAGSVSERLKKLRESK